MALSAPLADVSSRRYWLAAAAYTVSLLLTQSVMGYGIDGFKALWGEDALEVVAYLIVGAGAFIVVAAGWRLWGRCSPGERAWVAVALVLYGAGTLTARYPQERLHYLGYGVLAVILYVGFARDRGAKNPSAAPGNQAPLQPAAAAVLLGSTVGLADELLQIVWPRRYFDWSDVGMNVVAVVLGVLVAIPLWNAVRR